MIEGSFESTHRFGSRDISQMRVHCKSFPVVLATIQGQILECLDGSRQTSLQFHPIPSFTKTLFNRLKSHISYLRLRLLPANWVLCLLRFGVVFVWGSLGTSFVNPRSRRKKPFAPISFIPWDINSCWRAKLVWLVGWLVGWLVS